jgi:CheY-like chemotaxis protein
MPTGSRILIAEDMAVLLRALEKLFTHHGYVVKACADGKEAFEAFQSEAWDLVVTDVCMPRMDGITLAEEVRRIAPDMPVLFVTGSAGETPVADRLRREIASNPQSSVLHKPVNFAALLRETEALLDGRVHVDAD